MEHLLEKILDILINTEKWDIRLFIAIFFVLLLVFFTHKEARETFCIFVRKIYSIMTKNYDVDPLSSALFLNEKSYLLRIKEIKFSDPDKNYIFKVILTVKAVTVISLAKDFISDKKNYKKIPKEELVSKLTLMTHRMISTYEDKIKEEFYKKYGAEVGDKIYNCVYDNQYGKIGFKQYHEGNIDSIFKMLDGFLRTPGLNNNFILTAYMSIVNVALSRAISELYDTFIKFNGDLKKIINDNRRS